MAGKVSIATRSVKLVPLGVIARISVTVKTVVYVTMLKDPVFAYPGSTDKSVSKHAQQTVLALIVTRLAPAFVKIR